MIQIGTADYYQPLTDFERRAGVLPPPAMPGNPCRNTACPCNTGTVYRSESRITEAAAANLEQENP